MRLKSVRNNGFCQQNRPYIFLRPMQPVRFALEDCLSLLGNGLADLMRPDICPMWIFYDFRFEYDKRHKLFF